jgi:hypothetical protein
MKRLPLTGLVGTLLLAMMMTACATGGTGSAAGPSSSRDILVIEAHHLDNHTDALSLLSAIRPQWLSTRGSSSIHNPEQVQVFIDDIAIGGIAALRQINLRTVQSIQYYGASAATQRWGTGHAAGAIVLRTR